MERKGEDVRICPLEDMRVLLEQQPTETSVGCFLRICCDKLLFIRFASNALAPSF